MATRFRRLDLDSVELPPGRLHRHLCQQRLPGDPAEHQHVLAPPGGQQHERQGGLEAHSVPRLPEPHLLASDLRGHHNSGVPSDEDAAVHVRVLRVGPHIHLDQRLLQGTRDCSGQVSLVDNERPFEHELKMHISLLDSSTCSKDPAWRS